MHLTRYVAQERGELQQAEEHCRRLLDFGDPAKERAKELLSELRALQAEADDDMAMDSDSDAGQPPGQGSVWQ